MVYEVIQQSSTRILPSDKIIRAVNMVYNGQVYEPSSLWTSGHQCGMAKTENVLRRLVLRESSDTPATSYIVTLFLT